MGCVGGVSTEFVLLACPARTGHASQHRTASICTAGPRLNFHGAPRDPGVWEAGWSLGPNTKRQETTVAMVTAELPGEELLVEGQKTPVPGGVNIQGPRLGRHCPTFSPLALADQAEQWRAIGSAPRGRWR